MLKRPSKDDTDEDLLRFQKEFLASKSAPAVTLVKKTEKRKTDTNNDNTEPRNKDVVEIGELPSKFGSTGTPEKRVRFQNKTSNQADDEDDAEERLEKHDRHIAKVLSEIVEHDFKSPHVYFPVAQTHGGFPKVFHRGSDLKDESQKGPKKKSLFAQQFLREKAEKFGVASDETSQQPFLAGDVLERNIKFEDMDTSTVGPALITGEGLGQMQAADEKSKIHEENLAALSGMSEEEILSEQAKLLESFDPSLVEFIKKKRQQSALSSTASKSKTTFPEEVLKLPSSKDASNIHSTAKISKVDLPVKPKREWVNMTNIEYDKLEWMSTLPTPKPGDSGTGYTARFDFKGCLVADDADIPVHLGLHHHGKEPEKAGYTLEEIFQLCRSSNMQQRVMAMHMLENIIINARHGKFFECASTYIIPALIEGGLIFILRWALDDSTDNNMAASVSLLHSLLVCKNDELGLDLTFHWFHGHQVPNLSSQDPEDTPETETEDSEKPTETDADIVKKDIVQGLLRMSLLPRLRYILTKWHPPASVVIQILEILIRISRHSTQAAYQVSQCAGLLETIFKEFLPLNWNPITESVPSLADVYGYPVPQALKLIRVLCSAGRNIAANLLGSYNIMPCVTRYICDTQRSLQLQPKEAEALYLEAFRTWQVCSSYGLATLYYENMYSILFTRLQSLHGNAMEVSDKELQTIGTALMTLLESITQVAASVTVENIKQKSTPADLSNADSNISRALPPIDWSQVQGLFQPVINNMQNELKFFTCNYFEKPYDLSYLSAVINFVATYLGQLESQPGYDVVDTLSLLENICDTFLVPCINSQAFQLTLSYLRQNSVLLKQVKGKRGEVAENLPEIGALCGDNAEKCPVLHVNATVHFLIAFTRLLLTIGRTHKGLVSKLFPLVLEHEEVLQYVRKLCLWQKTAPLAMNHFSKFENQLQYSLITMCRLCTTKSGGNTKLYHLMSLYLLMHLHQGDEYFSHSLLSTVTFNSVFLTDVTSDNLAPTANIEALKIEEEKFLKSATSEVVKKAHTDLMKDSYDNLVAVRNSYLLAVAGLVASLQESRNRAIPNPLDVDKLHTGDVGQLLVPVDWPFLPLVELYNSTVQRQSSTKKGPNVMAHIESIVTNSLRWVYVMECWRPGVLDSVSVTLKLSRLMCVFLAENDLFLNSNIHGYLLSLLKIYCKPGKMDRINLEEKVPGLASFYDLYVHLLVHYDAVSFGDQLFASYVLLPQQQRHDIKYRQAVWVEHTGVLQALTLPLSQVIIPIENFLEPEETKLELLRLYFQGLYSGTVTQNRTPLPYLIAVHHVNRFFYTQDGKHKKLKEAFIKQAGGCKNKTLQLHLFYYKAFQEEEKFGIGMYDELPQSRKKLLEYHGINVAV